MSYYKVELGTANVTIVEASTIEKAKSWALRTFGTYMEPRVSDAAVEDVNWVKGMGGVVHTTE